LSVVDAAILILGEDADEKEEIYDNGSYVGEKQKTSYKRFEAVFRALRIAILKNRLRAILSFPARGAVNYTSEYSILGEDHYHTAQVDLGEEFEEKIIFDYPVSAEGGAKRLHLGGPIVSSPIRLVHFEC
jgi:hypothetical protein